MTRAEPVTEPVTDETTTPRLDAWGNTILDAPGPLGQYRIQSARDGRILRVCGEAATTKHLLFWDYDGSERRCVCGLCWRLTPAPDGDRVGEQAVGGADDVYGDV